MRRHNPCLRIVPSLLAACLASFIVPARPTTRQSDAESPRLFPTDKEWVTRTLERMSLRDKVAQLVHVRVPGRFLNRRSAEFLKLEDEIRRNHVGGVVIFAGDVYETAVLLNELQELSPVPLIVAADFERGAAFRITDATSFPWTMAIGATGSEQFAYQEGVITAREARALGVHWIYAPVLDVNNNPDNPVINIRSYGEDPRLVARLGSAFIRGARDNGVLTTAKHFPGHGDTATDSHIGLAVVGSDRAQLESVELVPFEAAIAAGVDSIMTAHVAVPQVTSEPDTPATLSSKVLTDLLRGSLGFQGLTVTDAMEMGGVTNRYWTGLASIRALQAGADLLLLPMDAEVAINEVVRAVERGDIPEERIDQSVDKLLSAKTRVQLHKLRTVPLDPIAALVGTPENRKLGQEIADASITLLRDNQHLLPINPIVAPKIFSLVLSSDPDTAPGAVFQAELRQRFPNARTAAADPRIPEDLEASVLKSAEAADLVVCATLVRPVSGKGSVALPLNQVALIEKLLGAGKPLGFVAFGNPYVLRLFPQVSTYLCTFSYADVSQAAAAKALCGEIALSGRMPVSIPGQSQLGDGLQLPALEMTLKSASPESKGLPAGAFDETKRLLQGFVDDRAFPGAALMVGYRGSLVLAAPVGRLDYSPDSAPVTADTIYDLASLSKAVGTTTAAMMLVERGRLLLDVPVQDYLPEFKGANKEKARISNLLTHSAGLPAWLPLYKEAEGYAGVLKKVFDVLLEYEPGTKSQYSDMSMMLMGEIIARACGRPLDRFLSDSLFAPLGMKSTLYNPPKALLERIAPTEEDPWRKRVVRGEVHDENAYAMGGVTGHAGLFSTGKDLALFAQMLLNGGIYDHKRYLKPETIARFTSMQGPPGSAQGFGWRKPSDSAWSGGTFSSAAYGHTGFTGTSIWIDPERQAFIILLSNRVHPSRQNQKIEEARRVLCQKVMDVLKAAPAGQPGRDR